TWSEVRGEPFSRQRTTRFPVKTAGRPGARSTSTGSPNHRVPSWSRWPCSKRSSASAHTWSMSRGRVSPTARLPPPGKHDGRLRRTPRSSKGTEKRERDPSLGCSTAHRFHVHLHLHRDLPHSQGAVLLLRQSARDPGDRPACAPAP